MIQHDVSFYTWVYLNRCKQVYLNVVISCWVLCVSI